jgi:hypothetical protein
MLPPHHPRCRHAVGDDEFVGKYVISQKGEELEIKITRRGHSLFEQWGEDKADEILPGKHDTFFARGESIMELFLRNRNGNVTGILYTVPDAELEATRLADVSVTRNLPRSRRQCRCAAQVA